MRSIALATQTVSREPVIVRGSSIMNVISCRSIKRNCSSTPLSSRMISAAATASLLELLVIDPFVGFDHLVGLAQVALLEAVDRHPQLGLDQPAHLQDAPAQ